jgi:hypothetical protein
MSLFFRVGASNLDKVGASVSIKKTVATIRRMA